MTGHWATAAFAMAACRRRGASVWPLSHGLAFALGLVCCDWQKPSERELRAAPKAVRSPSDAPAQAGWGYLARGCRVVRVRGAVVGSHGRPLYSGAVLQGERWLTLAEGARAELQFQKGGKRFALEGPAKVLPCVAGEEVFLVGQGVLRSQHSPGRRPAAEALWATPQAAIRYGDAMVEAQVTAEQLSLRVERGEARTVGPAAVSVTPAHGSVLVASPPSSVQSAVLRCFRAAETAFQRAVELLRAAAPHLAERASAQVAARRVAEEHCAVAVATALQRLAGKPLQHLLVRLDEARARLRAIPQASDPQ